VSELVGYEYQKSFPRNDQYSTLGTCLEIAARDATKVLGRVVTVAELAGAADPVYPIWRVWIPFKPIERS
jgi:hypothetical protein